VGGSAKKVFAVLVSCMQKTQENCLVKNTLAKFYTKSLSQHIIPNMHYNATIERRRQEMKNNRVLECRCPMLRRPRILSFLWSSFLAFTHTAGRHPHHQTGAEVMLHIPWDVGRKAKKRRKT
jgi:hypothetical protein